MKKICRSFVAIILCIGLIFPTVEVTDTVYAQEGESVDLVENIIEEIVSQNADYEGTADGEDVDVSQYTQLYELSVCTSEEDSVVLATAVDEGEDSSITSDTVLVLDISGSMSGEPMKHMKKAATNFVKKFYGIEGNHRCAIVVFSDKAVVSYLLTSNLFEITYQISRINRASGNTNLYDGLVKADELLSESPAKMRNIVVMADGIPCAGTAEVGTRYERYYSKVGKNINYGQAVYNYYENNLAKRYNVYSLGFYHSLGSNYSEYAEEFMNDIQNSGYYSVVDGEELEFAFEDIADKITSQYPIIIVPGVMGSHLFADENCTQLLWSPVDKVEGAEGSLKMGIISDKMRMSERVYTKDYEKTLAVQREYGTQDTYMNLIETLLKDFENERDIYFFSYDFRQSNRDTAYILGKFISKLADKHGKVDLVCHSMGGIVVSQYVASSEYNAEEVNKIITLGTPYEGAPKLINAMVNWDVLGQGVANDGMVTGIFDSVLGGYLGLKQEIKTSFPGVAELCPNYRYVEDTTFYERVKTGIFSKENIEIDDAQYEEFCRSIFGRAENYNGTNNNFDMASEKQDDIINNGVGVLAALDNTYFAVGTNLLSISSIVFSRGKDGNVDSVMNGSVSDLVFTNNGDGTVPIFSAQMAGNVGDKLGKDRLGRERYREFPGYEHSELAGKNVAKTNSIYWVESILRDDDISMEEEQTDDIKRYIVIRVACPVEVAITLDGETLCSDVYSDEEEFKMNSSYGDIYLCGEKGEIKIAALYDSEDYNIVLKGTDEGKMDYSIRFYDGNNELEVEHNFYDVPVTEESIFYSGTCAEEVLLSADKDGDGVIDTTYLPSNDGTMEKIDNNTYRYETEQIEVVYQLTSQYGNTYHVDTTITNTTNETIHNWILEVPIEDRIQNIWNGVVLQDDTLRIKNAGYNQDILSGESVNFGFIANYESEVSIPRYFKLKNVYDVVDDDKYCINYELASEWENGYNGYIVITNLSDQIIEDWKLEFDYEDLISSVWNGKIIRQTEKHYVVQNVGYNANIQPGDSVKIGFTATKLGECSEVRNSVLFNVVEK